MREQPRGRQRGELAQRLQDEGHVRVDDDGPRRGAGRRQPGLREHAAHGVVMHAQLPGDGAHAPLLDVVAAQDLALRSSGPMVIVARCPVARRRTAFPSGQSPRKPVRTKAAHQRRQYAQRRRVVPPGLGTVERNAGLRSAHAATLKGSRAAETVAAEP